MTKKEYLPVIDKDGNVTGQALRSTCHDGKSMLLHPVIHLHIFDNEGRLYLQKRSMEKDVQPGKWDTSVGGHVDPGETAEEALIRETEEEAGITGFKPEFITRYIWESEIEREMVHSFITVTDIQPLPNPDEVSEGRFWTVNEILESLDNNIFTPNFEYEFEMVLGHKGKLSNEQ